jgi:rRNA pseudouridine-1189 N-methylase Emg1 (Nep1/Mra1 family)
LQTQKDTVKQLSRLGEKSFRQSGFFERGDSDPKNQPDRRKKKQRMFRNPLTELFYCGKIVQDFERSSGKIAHERYG